MKQKKLNCVIYEEEGHYVALCLNCGVASQGDTYEEAVKNIKEAVELYYEDEEDDNFNGYYTPISTVSLTEQFLNA